MCLYDPTAGETKLLPQLAKGAGVEITVVSPPSPEQTMQAAVARAVERSCEVHEGDLVAFFKSRIPAAVENMRAHPSTAALLSVGNDERGGRGGVSASDDRLTELLLARALAALSGLGSLAPARSLLTADAAQRTVLVSNGADDPDRALSPSEVVTVCKALGSGKLSRVSILSDGTAVFDLPTKRAVRLVDAAAADTAASQGLPDGWSITLPTTLSVEPFL